MTPNLLPSDTSVPVWLMHCCPSSRYVHRNDSRYTHGWLYTCLSSRGLIGWKPIHKYESRIRQVLCNWYEYIPVWRESSAATVEMGNHMESMVAFYILIRVYTSLTGVVRGHSWNGKPYGINGRFLLIRVYTGLTGVVRGHSWNGKPYGINGRFLFI